MKKNYFYNLLLTAANILIPVLSFPYASHILGPPGIGKAQFALSLAMYFAMFSALGIPSYGVIEIAKYRDDPQKLSKVFSELFTIHVIFSLLFFLIYLGLIFFSPFFNSEIPLHLSAGLIILFGFTSIDWFYFGIEEFKVVAIRSILIKCVSVVLLFLYVKNADDYGVYLWTMIFATLGNNVLSLFFLRKHVYLQLINLEIKKYFKPLFYILGTTLAASMYTMLDTILLGFLSDKESVGLYTAATKLTKIAIPFITSVGVIIIPQISYSFKNNDQEQLKQLLNKSYSFIITFSFPIVLGLILLAPELIVLFSGKSFLPATTSMQVMAALPLLIGLGHLYGVQMLIPFGYAREMFVSTSCGVVCCLLLNILLVPLLNELGTAIANVICELTVTSLYIYFIRKHSLLNVNWKPVLQAISASLLFIPIVMYVKSWKIELLYSLGYSISLCAATYFIVQVKVFKNVLIINIVREVVNKFNFRGLTSSEE